MMNRKITFTFLVSILLMQFSAKAQFDFTQVDYWVGTGSDSSVMIVDFHDGSKDSSYVWGVLFNDSTDGETMLNTIGNADINLTPAINGGFLNDITYGMHSGIAGTPNYWGTFSGTDISNLYLNMGIGTTVKNKDIFACNYSAVDASWNALFLPGTPISAYDPTLFTLTDVDYFVGTGSDTAVLVIDFQNGNNAFAWGYIFSDSTTGEDMLNALSADDSHLGTASAGGFLSDITYYNHSGIGGSPNYWGTWSATNLGNWSMNMGMGTVVKNGGFFGLSYTNFMPALRPNTPNAAPNTTNIVSLEKDILITTYPNPTSDFVTIDSEETIENATIVNAQGKVVFSSVVNSKQTQINVQGFARGMYFIQVQAQGQVFTKTVIKQ